VHNPNDRDLGFPYHRSIYVKRRVGRCFGKRETGS
jgi:hypothetical protein